MHIEKRKAQINKTYTETRHELESLEGAVLELQGLLKRITNKIEELSSYLRNVEDSNIPEEGTSEMNRLKLQHQYIKRAKERVENLDRTQWFKVRDEIQETFDKAQKEIQVASSIMEK